VSLEQLDTLCRGVSVPPRFVQNRCYARQMWDRDVRRFCTQHNMIYQGFSLLTANRDVLAHPEMKRLSRDYNRTAPQIVFRFALDIGMLPLTGTTNAAHMQADLQVFDFEIAPADIARIEKLAIA
jgi:diketogulonate reductase-like aldo/keto reductase